MKDIVSKFSLYDILAMIVPGGTILLYISLSLLENTLIFDVSKAHASITWAIILIVSYLLGLINQYITSQIWKSFRNNPYINTFMSSDSIKYKQHKDWIFLPDTHKKTWRNWKQNQVIARSIFSRGSAKIMKRASAAGEFLSSARAIIVQSRRMIRHISHGK